MAWALTTGPRPMGAGGGGLPKGPVAVDPACRLEEGLPGMGMAGGTFRAWAPTTGPWWLGLLIGAAATGPLEPAWVMPIPPIRPVSRMVLTSFASWKTPFLKLGMKA